MKNNKRNILKTFVAIFSICCMCIGQLNPILAHAESALSDIPKAALKDEILKNYPPNLSEMQEVGFGIKTVAPNGELVEQKIRPDVHFRGEDGKEYLVFYNNHIEQLRSIIYKKLKNNINDHSLILANGKELIRIANVNQSTKETKWSITDPLCPLKKLLGKFSLNYDKINHEATSLSYSSANLLTYYKMYGSNLAGSAHPYVAIVDRNLGQVANLEIDESFSLIEQELYSIMISNNSYKNTVDQLGASLDKYLSLMAPESSNTNAMAFCFPLNRASYYLSNLESDIVNKDLETLEAMYTLRKKINSLILEYRFMLEQNKAPILGITIDRYKIIIEDEHRTMIFLDQDETKKFIATIEKMIDSKASIISKKYSFNAFTGKQLRELAESLKPDSFQDIIDKEDQELARMEAMSSQALADAGTAAARSAVRVVLDGTSLRLANRLVDDVKEYSEGTFSLEEVKKYLQSQKENNSKDTDNNVESNGETNIQNNSTESNNNSTTVSNSTATLSNSSTTISNSTAALSNNSTQPSNSTVELSNNSTQASNSTAALSNNSTQSSNSTAALSNNSTQPSNSTAALSNNSTQPSNSTVALSNNLTQPSNSTAALSSNSTQASNSTATLSNSSTTISNSTVGSSNTSTPSNTNPTSTVLENKTEQDENLKKLDENKTALERLVGSLNLTPYEKASLHGAFGKYLEHTIMQSDIQLKRDKKDFLIKVKKEQEDFINLFKLYVLMIRYGYVKRTDFGGILLEENRSIVAINGQDLLLREYFIREIQRLDNVL